MKRSCRTYPTFWYLIYFFSVTAYDSAFNESSFSDEVVISFDSTFSSDPVLPSVYILYQNYCDIEIIEDHFEAYEKYVENISRDNPDLIWRNGLGNNYGDWLNGNTLRAKGFPKTVDIYINWDKKGEK